MQDISGRIVRFVFTGTGIPQYGTIFHLERCIRALKLTLSKTKKLAKFTIFEGIPPNFVDFLTVILF